MDLLLLLDTPVKDRCGRYRYTVRQCKDCGIFFTPKQKSAMTFCSKGCAVANKNRHRVWRVSTKLRMSNRAKVAHSGINNPNYKGGGKQFHCIECGAVFSVALHSLRAKKHSGIFCTLSCCNTYKFNRKMSGTQRKVNKEIACSINHMLRHNSKGTSPKCKLFDYLGYSFEELKQHLEHLFAPGMSWYNYGIGGWHVDHVKPVSYFMFDSLNHTALKECWALSNLQPLWELDNLSKGGRNTNVNKLKYG